MISPLSQSQLSIYLACQGLKESDGNYQLAFLFPLPETIDPERLKMAFEKVQLAHPYMLSRPKKRNFFIWNIIYSSTWIYRLYHALYVLKSQKSKVYPSCDIYAGHGSFMLFTKAFVEQYP